MDLARIRSVPLFSSLDDEDLARLAETMEEVDLPKDKVLAFEGESAFKFFIIEEGTASVSKHGGNVRTLGPGDFFGEIALLESERRTATVVADEDMKAIVLMGWDLRELEESFPSIGEEIRARMKERLEADRSLDS